jgi:hypothetical protein
MSSVSFSDPEGGRSEGMTKEFRLKPGDIRPVAKGYGACIATDRITVDGEPVGYMYREEAEDPVDSGWVFMAGTETQEYMDDPANSGVYDVNTVANYDPDIIQFLDAPVGSRFSRLEPGSPLAPEAD